MATYKGKEGTVSIGATVGTATSVGELRSFEVETSANLVDVSRMGDAWTRDVSTQKSWRATLEMWWDHADTGQDLLVAGDLITLNLFPQGNGVALTDVYLSGQATIESVSQKQGHDTVIERTVVVKGYGALTEGTV